MLRINQSGEIDSHGDVSIFFTSDKLTMTRMKKDYSLTVSFDGDTPTVETSIENSLTTPLTMNVFGDLFSRTENFSVIKIIVESHKKYINDEIFNAESLKRVIAKFDIPELTKKCNRYRRDEFDLPNITEEDLQALLELHILSFPALSEYYPEITERCFTDNFYGTQSYHVQNVEASYSKTMKDYCVEMFGFYRKDLLKVLTNSDINAHSILSVFKNRVKDEEFISVLKNINTENIHYEGGLDELGNFITVISDSSVSRLFANVVEEFSIIRHVLLAYSDYSKTNQDELPDFNTWEEYLHFLIVENANRDNSDISIPDYLKFDHIIIDEEVVKVTPILTPNDFILYGHKLDNCLKTNTDFIRNTIDGTGYCFMIAFPDGTEGAVEVTISNDEAYTTVKQALMKSNKEFPESVETQIRKAFTVTTQQNIDFIYESLFSLENIDNMMYDEEVCLDEFVYDTVNRRERLSV